MKNKIGEGSVIYDRYRNSSDLVGGIMSGKGARNDAVFSHWIEDSHCF